MNTLFSHTYYYRAAATAFSIDSILHSASSSSGSSSSSSILSSLPTPLSSLPLPFSQLPVSCLPSFLPPPDLMPPLLPATDRKKERPDQEESLPARPPLSLFPGLYYPPGPEGGGMLSQVLMSLSARHHRHPAERGPGRDIKEEVSHDQTPLQLHHSPEISSTQGTSPVCRPNTYLNFRDTRGQRQRLQQRGGGGHEQAGHRGRVRVVAARLSGQDQEEEDGLHQRAAPGAGEGQSELM